MGVGDRFFLSHYEFQRDREVLFKDIGTHLRVSGTVFQGMGSTLILLAPSATAFEIVDVVVAQPSLEEWSAILRQGDVPEVFVGEAGGIAKALHRKQRYEISGAVQQQVWVRDGLACVYCKRRMGDVQLTIDHWVPLELGGLNDTRNFLSACRRCNKEKGMMHPRDFCALKGYDFEAIDAYLNRVAG